MSCELLLLVQAPSVWAGESVRTRRIGVHTLLVIVETSLQAEDAYSD